MKNLKKLSGRIAACLFAAALMLSSLGLVRDEACAQELEAGTYEISGELSAYLAAMGGVEFGGPLMTGIYFVLDEDGNEYLTLTFTKSSVTIYSVTCDTFVDASPSTITTTRGVEDGVIGIYDTNGDLVTEGVTYTLSEDTALNSANEEVNYVDSVTFPISSREETYYLALYINSNVMGVEFCNENDEATESTYQATLTVNWSVVEALEAGEELSDETQDTETEETQESLEANEELSGLSIYTVEDDTDASEETDAQADTGEADADTQEAAQTDTGADAGEADADTQAEAETDEVLESSGSQSTMLILVAAFVVAVILIVLVVMKNKKKTGSEEK